MAITAGTISIQDVGPDYARLLASAPTGGTGPYTFQWHRSQTNNFTPSGGTALAGKTSLALDDSGLIPNTTYYYKLVATDTGAGNATVTYPQATVVTKAQSFQPNAFGQTALIGQTDLHLNFNTVSVMIDESQAGDLPAGAPVKIVDSAGGVPKVVGVTADTDEVYGYLNYNPINATFRKGMAAEMSMAGNCIRLFATTAIGRGKQVQLTTTTTGGVALATDGSGKTLVGWAYDKAVRPGDVIRVILSVPSFTVA